MRLAQVERAVAAKTIAVNERVGNLSLGLRQEALFDQNYRQDFSFQHSMRISQMRNLGMFCWCL